MVRAPGDRQVPPHAALRADARLQPQVGAAARLEVEHARSGPSCTSGPSAGSAAPTATVVLDNLREGVLTPDVYDPTLNPLYRDVLAHYGVVALPCRVRDPDRKGKVESGVGHAQRTPLQGLRFETLEEAQAYLDRWEARWADTRIHGTTKRQVAAMFAEEKPHSAAAAASSRFATTQYGERTVHLDGCVEVDGAYYSAPPGWIGRALHVQWDGCACALLDPTTGQLLREHLRAEPRPPPHPRRGSPDAHAADDACSCSRRARRAGEHIGALCASRSTATTARPACAASSACCSLAKKHGAPTVDDACADGARARRRRPTASCAATSSAGPPRR